ncbi:RNA-binding S4 domain-containing protein [Candidatus Fermentibacteria bacterium]|nr:RNA-binding S4 domain-containing protein [Candidatus Fermentibacteria bacterium]
MRIDIFARATGLLKSRETAKKACSGGFALINGREARPSSEVAPGDTIELEFPDGRTARYEVLAIPGPGSVPKSRRCEYLKILGGEGD